MSDLFEDLDQQRVAGQEHDAETLIRGALDRSRADGEGDATLGVSVGIA
jgi:hypothetical protein